MTGYLSQANPHSFCWSLTSFSTNQNQNHPLVQCRSLRPSKVMMKMNHLWPNQEAWGLVKGKKDKGLIVVGCASWGLEAELEKELEAEMKEEEEMGSFRHKCGERKGVVELLECLEKEAIMGEDVGKQPEDYNRRAHIFDSSSKVFQALKQLNNGDAVSTQSSK